MLSKGDIIDCLEGIICIVIRSGELRSFFDSQFDRKSGSTTAVCEICVACSQIRTRKITKPTVG